MIARHHARAVLLSLGRLLCLSVLLLLSSLPTISQAQITLDGSLGHRGALHGPNYTISDRVGQIRGPNLFHSFGQFNLSKGESATFTGPNTIANILSRVTGGSPSNIDGTIRSQIPKANFYLINPSGVMFCPNASLDVSGSFHVSTADYLRLADGATFSAHLAVPTVLSVAPPAAFGFLGPTPESITVKGSTRLQVPSGETFAIVGGEITIAGNPEQSVVGVPTLSAFGGRIHLESVGSAGEVALPQPGQPLDREVGSVARAGTVSLIKGARIDASTADTGQAGRVTVVARDVRLEGGESRIAAVPSDRGAGGEIAIHTDTLTLLGGKSQIDVRSGNQGTGPAGRVTVVARDVRLEGGGILAQTNNRGDGGEINVQADRLTLTRNAEINSSTTGAGHGGRVRVTAREVLLEGGGIEVGTGGGGGAGGEVVIWAGMLTLTGEARINSSSFGAGRGGDITVMASEAIVLEGQGQQPARIASDALRTGAAGRVMVSAPTVRLDNGRIQASVNESGSGDAGEVTVQAGTLTLTRGALITSRTTGAGNAGMVTVAATEAIIIADTGSRISGETDGGNGGRVVVRAPTVRLEAEGSITTAVSRENSRGVPSSGNGGEITVEAGTLRLIGGERSVVAPREWGTAGA